MSERYDEYLNDHIGAVSICYKLLTGEELPEHDSSKYSEDEYRAYDDFFYGEHTEEVEKAFKYAWNHHQKTNPHHWQYWVLINDDEGTVCLDMPERYINEMVADWGAFSLLKEEPEDIITWYEEHKEDIMLSPATREIVEKKIAEMSERIAKYLGEESHSKDTWQEFLRTIHTQTKLK